MSLGGDVAQKYYYAIAHKGMSSWDSLPQTEIVGKWPDVVKEVKKVALENKAEVRLSKSKGYNNQGYYFHWERI